MSQQDKIESFWNWFKENNHKYLFLSDISEDEKENLMDDFLSHLHEYCDDLYFEIGGHPDDEDVELIITAEGVIEHFDKVELLIDSAPKIKNWNLIKFKQPHGPGFVTTYEGTKFDPDKIIFIPLENKKKPDLVGIQVCYPELTEENRNKYSNATYIVLDALIGEKSVACDIDFLEVINTPADISEFDFRHLSDIGEFIKERKKNAC